MSWLESHQELRDHPKTARLRRRLGVSLPQAIGHLHLLWWWALDYAPTGHLALFDADVIADAACWEDDPGVFVRALIGAGFLNDDLTIHDWDDYTGRLIDRREANAKRMRTARQARRDQLLAQAASGARPVDGTTHTTGTFTGRERLPDLNLTGPDLNLTGPDPPPKPPSHGEGGSAADAARAGGQRRSNTLAPHDEVSARVILSPLDSATAQLWRRALDAVAVTVKPGNADQLRLLEPLGRDDAGGLHLRAPPGLGLGRFQRNIALALADAGDQAAQGVVIREG